MMKYRFKFVLWVITVAILTSAPSARAGKNPFDWAFIHLEFVRAEKSQQLRRLCDRLRDLARRASEDETVIEAFAVNHEYFREKQRGSQLGDIENDVKRFRQVFDTYYIDHYWAFYDMLFINRQGDIFYTMRKQSDYQQNLFNDPLSRTPLAQHLNTRPRKEVFVDFHYYGVSKEPAAFIVEPVTVDGEHDGWIAMQCAINKVNSLFAGSEELGATGETFIVNRDGYMLTESNFEGNDTILKKRLDDRNIKAKFKAGQGRLKVNDYRGFTALTSFEVFDFLGTQWLVVAKVDEAQVVTEHFKQHRRFYTQAILDHLRGHQPPPGKEPLNLEDKEVIRVDMEEFARANHGEILNTPGVSTCTGFIATYPGKFGYLGHLSPLDRAYGGNAANMVGQIVKKIKTYDIYSYERRRVRFVIVAPHFDSMPGIVDTLVREGFLLSQISMLHHPEARRADVSYDYSEDRVMVRWRLEDSGPADCIHHGEDAHNLGEVLRDTIRSDDETQIPTAPSFARQVDP